MKKVYIVGAAFAACMVLSMVSAAASSAIVCIETGTTRLSPKYNSAAKCEELEGGKMLLSDANPALWMLWADLFRGGTEVTSSINVTTEGLIELVHLAGGFLEPEAVVDCEGAFDGTGNLDGKGTITAVLNASKVEVTLTNTLACTNVKNCPEPLVVAEDLPWDTQLVSEESGIKEIIFSGGTGNPAYEIRCDGLAIETLCEGETEALLSNGASGIEGEFIASELESDGLEGNCGSSTKVALQKGKGTTKLAEGTEILSVKEV